MRRRVPRVMLPIAMSLRAAFMGKNFQVLYQGVTIEDNPKISVPDALADDVDKLIRDYKEIFKKAKEIGTPMDRFSLEFEEENYG